MALELVAQYGCCEEASMLSQTVYIPCNAPAVVLVNNGDRRPYRMCEACACHNVKNRRAKVVRYLTAEERNR